jgi:hypothetical protein
MREEQTRPPAFEKLARFGWASCLCALGWRGERPAALPDIDTICQGSPYFGGISLLMAFSCWLSAFCSDFVIWPPFWLAMARSSCRT